MFSRGCSEGEQTGRGVMRTVRHWQVESKSQNGEEGVLRIEIQSLFSLSARGLASRVG